MSDIPFDDMNRSKWFEAAIVRITPRLNAFIAKQCRQRGISDPNVRDDIYQETVAVMKEKLDQFDDNRCNLKNSVDNALFYWACGIARNKIRQKHADLQKRKTIPISPDYPTNDQDEDSPNEIMAALSSCVATLSDEENEIVTRRYFNKESIRDIAIEIYPDENENKSKHNLSARLYRARNKIKSCLIAKLGDEWRL